MNSCPLIELRINEIPLMYAEQLLEWLRVESIVTELLWVESLAPELLRVESLCNLGVVIRIDCGNGKCWDWISAQSRKCVMVSHWDSVIPTKNLCFTNRLLLAIQEIRELKRWTQSLQTASEYWKIENNLDLMVWRLKFIDGCSTVRLVWRHWRGALIWCCAGGSLPEYWRKSRTVISMGIKYKLGKPREFRLIAVTNVPYNIFY